MLILFIPPIICNLFNQIDSASISYKNTVVVIGQEK